MPCIVVTCEVSQSLLACMNIELSRNMVGMAVTCEMSQSPIGWLSIELLRHMHAVLASLDVAVAQFVYWETFRNHLVCSRISMQICAHNIKCLTRSYATLQIRVWQQSARRSRQDEMKTLLAEPGAAPPSSEGSRCPWPPRFRGVVERKNVNMPHERGFTLKSW